MLAQLAKMCIIWAHFNTADEYHDTKWFRGVDNPLDCTVATLTANVYQAQHPELTIIVCPDIKGIEL